MKKLFLILALFASLSVDAQYVTTYAKNAASQTEGVYYYLPRTVIKLELTIEETQYYIGPYAEFAAELLGTTDYIKENKTETVVQNVDIQIGSEADPNAACFIEFDDKGKEILPNIILDNDGIITAVGYDNLPQDMSVARNLIEYTYPEIQQETEVSFIEIIENQDDDDDDYDEEGRPAKKKATKEDKARIAVENIDKVRSSIVDLVSGVQEVDFGNSINYMIEKLKTIENEYVSLFKGKKITHTYKKCFYITPDENHANANISCGKLDNGETVKILFDTNNSSVSINKLSVDVLNAGQTNKLYYRMPAQTNTTITLGKETLATKTLIISQFGELRLISTKNNKLLFNPNTGQIISITH